MRDVIDAVRPRYIVIENVAALLRDVEAFSEVLSDLSGLRFDAEWDVVSACSVGAPHTRRRLFVVAYPHGSDGFPRMGAVLHGPGQVSKRHHRASAWRDRVDEVLEATGSDARDTDGLSVEMVRALGNAVVPQVSEYIGLQLMEMAA
jgi:DNA (cytosine-5)-methyltransferase 1